MPFDAEAGFWTPEQEQWFRDNPDGPYSEFRADFPEAGRSFAAWRVKRATILPAPRSAARREAKALWRREDTLPDMPLVEWDKAEADFSWRDLIRPGAELQAIAKRASGSQDFATIHIESDRPVPVVFISDWHFGSWGADLDDFERWTDRIVRGPAYVAILGDMLQMSIVMRSMIEVSDNLFPPHLQIRGLEDWSEYILPKVLWSTWDNHAVMREEKLVGYSRYAEIWRAKTVYHSGIGHIDLGVGEQVYKVSTAHKFPGRSMYNATHGQSRYMRFQGIDREITVAGDSHVPGVSMYTDGPMPRCAVNCGSLQKDSGYAKRHFSLYTHDWMPTLVFWPDQHLFTAYPSLDHYEAAMGTA